MNDSFNQKEGPTMPTITLKQAIARRDAARTSYATAAKAFRVYYAELGALDVLLGSRGQDGRGFGIPPDVTSFRHAVALPEENGSLQSDMMRIILTTTIEG
jgi:hypothetical protein